MDGRIERAIHTFVLHHRWIVDLARILTHLGDPVVVTVLTVALALLLWWRGDRRGAVFVAATRLLAVVVSSVVKALVRRHRPVLAHPLAHAHGYSFPSGHALGSAALWASVAFVAAARGLSRGRAVALAVTVPVVVAATRVLLGVHYVTDVIGGLVLGWACAAICRRLTP
ncbi:MAG TPA: phosphatase PAP2 family protein [Mycobacteriales bacterium]|nr:phosphatase PAP2 family protein [Mycobacteriales bacterium]